MKKIAFVLTIIATLTSATACGAAWRDSNTNQGRPSDTIDGGTGAAPLKRIQLRRDTNANRLLMTPRSGECVWTTDTDRLYCGDGTTAGGIRVGLSGAELDVDTALDNLSDVDAPAPTNAYLLVWSSADNEWRAGQVAAGGIAEEAVTTGKMNDDGDTPVEDYCWKVAADTTAVKYETCGGSGYDTIYEENSAVTQRTGLKFAGTIATCADNGASTVCTFAIPAAYVTSTMLDDGAGSGIDADFLHGLSASGFLRADGTTTMTGSLNFNSLYALGLGVGAVASPAVSFNSDSNTGIYSPATDAVAFAAGGVQAFKATPSVTYFPLLSDCPFIYTEADGAMGCGAVTSDLAYAGGTISLRNDCANGQRLQFNTGTNVWDCVDLSGTFTYDPASLVDGAGETKSFSCTGAALGDIVTVGPAVDIQDMVFSAYVQAANTCEVRLQNESTNTVDLASSVWAYRIIE